MNARERNLARQRAYAWCSDAAAEHARETGHTTHMIPLEHDDGGWWCDVCDPDLAARYDANGGA